jgi:hypothetical protein
MNNIKYALLTCFGLINQSQKESISNDLHTNKEVATKIIDTLKNSANVRQFSPNQKHEARPILERAILIDMRIDEQIDSLAQNEGMAQNEATAQVTGLEINHVDIQNKGQTAHLLNVIAGDLQRPVGLRSFPISTWLSSNVYILKRNTMLTQDLIAKTQIGVEIEKQKSLLDDYADTSLEQPSHMDSDD